MCYGCDIHAPVIAPNNRFDVKWSSMTALPCLCGSLVFEHVQISWGRRSSWANLSCAQCVWKLTCGHYCLSFPGHSPLSSLVLICKWACDSWNYRKVTTPPPLPTHTHVPKNPLSFPSHALAGHSQQPVELPMNFPGVFLFQGAGQVSALPSASVTLSADV